MKEFTHTITDPNGLHARPAGLLAKEASKYASVISIVCNDKTVDAKRIFSVMTLGAKNGDSITVTADGSDEAVAAEALESFFRTNL